MRVTRVLAVSRRELRRSAAGRGGWGLLFFALALMLPAAALRLPGSTRPAVPAVSGEAPAALVGAVQLRPEAPTRLSPGPPVQVRTRALAPGLRAALEGTEARPAVQVRLLPGTLRLPGRALLVALLAISMLTGPLAETLPGEREAGTLEVLLSTSLSRGELVLGKWLAWTLAASAVALFAGVSGVLTGTTALGPWLLAMPAALGVAVALGLWLVRGAGDLVGGAAAPMRVLPLAAVGSVGLSLGLATAGGQPLLAAAVPLGGTLATASGLLPGAGPLVVAISASLAASLGLCAAVARTLDRQGVRPRQRGGGPWGPLLAGAFGWWLAVAGPGVFAVGGAHELLASPAVSVAAGGLLLALVAAVALARGPLPVLTRPVGLWRGVMVGVLLAASTEGLGAVAGPAWAEPLRARLDLALTPGAVGLLPALVVGLGQGLFFRGLLQRRLGLVGAALAQVLVLMPFDPLRGLLIALSLGILQARAGLGVALVAHLCLALLAGSLPVSGPPWLGLGIGLLAVGAAGLTRSRAGPSAQ